MDDQSNSQKPGGTWTPAPPRGASPQQPQQAPAPQVTQVPAPHITQTAPAPQAQESSLNDWNEQPPEQAPVPSTGYVPQQTGLQEGIGSLDDSTALMPEFKASISQFFGLLKGSIMKALAALVALQLAVVSLEIVATSILGIAGIGGALVSVVSGLSWLVGSILTVVVVVFSVTLFRPANDQVTGFAAESPADMMAALKVSSPAFVPVLLACLMCGGMVAAGSMFCLIPGVIAFIALFPMRYLSATRPDFTEYRFMQVMESSMMIGKKYWAAMLGLGLILGVVGGVAGGINAVVSTIAGVANVAVIQSMGSEGAGAAVTGVVLLISQVFQWVVTLVVLWATWVLEGGVMSVLAQRENLVRQSIGSGA